MAIQTVARVPHGIECGQKYGNKREGQDQDALKTLHRFCRH